MSLFGKASYLEALAKVPDTAQLQQEVVRDLLAHADQSSGTFRFSSQGDSAYRALLASPVRDSAAILMAFLAYRGANAGEAELGDIPVRIMRANRHEPQGPRPLGIHAGKPLCGDCHAAVQQNV